MSRSEPVGHLPGTIPGLLQRGCTTITTVEVSGYSMNDRPRSGTPTARPGTHLMVLDVTLRPTRPFWGVEANEPAVACASLHGVVYVCPFSGIELDLEDKTSRFHGVQWLMQQTVTSEKADAKGLRAIRPDMANLHPLFRPSHRFDVNRPCTLTVQEHRFGGAAIRLDQGASVYVEDYPKNQDSHAYCHMDNAFDLNPKDERLLADGSRWVEAEILRQAILHVKEVRRAG